jgi:hypothetical protein
MGRTKGLFVALFVIGLLCVGAGTVSAQRWDELGTKDVSDKPNQTISRSVHLRDS